MDTFSRPVVGSAIDSRAGADPATDALSIAIVTREPKAGVVIHGDRGPEVTCWIFTQRAQQAWLLPSLGSVGDPHDNAVIESFRGWMQVELLNRQRWRPRLDFSNATLEYIKGFHNPRRCYAFPNLKTPIEFEEQHTTRRLISSLPSL